MKDTVLEKEFLGRVDKLSTGERAALRRAGGKSLEQADANALAAFYRVLPHDISQYKEDCWFQGACIRCQWKPEDTMQIKMETALSMENRKQYGESLRKRLMALLDTTLDEDGFLAIKLWRLAKLLKQKGYVIDCAELIYDLCGWNNHRRFIQKKWARAFCESEIPMQEQTNDLEGDNNNAV